jgi:hypothetical protein
MRWLVLIFVLLGFCGVAQAQEPLARPMERTPSIMVGEESAAQSRTVKRRQATRAQPSRTRRTQASRVRSLPTPSASSVHEAETRSINNSISQQQQQQQLEQRQRVENNLLRQEIQRSTNLPVRTPSLGCRPGLIGC